jgi:lantibiotic biosynthesis protein
MYSWCGVHIATPCHGFSFSSYMEDQKDAAKVLRQICAALETYSEQTPAPGLLGGYTGCALFFAYYYRLTGRKKYLQKVHKLLLRAIHDLSAVPLPFSHCNGISGITWCIRHLATAGFVDAGDMEETFEEVDTLLGDAMYTALEEQRYDFLHEGLGLALYFLEQPDVSTARPYLETLLTQLEGAAIVFPEGVAWQDHITVTSSGKRSFNMGLAHGVPAIVSILGLMYHKGISPERSRALLEKAVSRILATRNMPEDALTALYPVLVDDDRAAMTGKQSRLGWCYGDLGIAIMLLNTGWWLENAAYQTTALHILKHTLHYRDLKNSSVVDACFCHGSAGIAHMYHRAYLTTGEQAFADGASRWRQHTLQLRRNEGPAGFQYHGKDGYENNFGLLEGIAGIGLSFIAALDKENQPAWDRCLLLS